MLLGGVARSPAFTKRPYPRPPVQSHQCAEGSDRPPSHPCIAGPCPSSPWTARWSRSPTTSRFSCGSTTAPTGHYAELRERTIWWVLAGSLVVLVFSRVYQRRWRYSGQRDYRGGARAIVVIVLLTVVGIEALRPVQRYSVHGTGGRATVGLPNGVIVLFGLLCLLFLIGVRVLARMIYERRPLAAFRGVREGERGVLIVGAGDGGRLVLREIARNRGLGLSPVGFLDDDPASAGCASTGCAYAATRAADLLAHPRRVRPRRSVDRDSLCARVHTRTRGAGVPCARDRGAHAADRVRAAPGARHDRAADARGARRGRARPRAGAHGARPRGRLSGRGDGARDGRRRLDRRGAVPADRARRAAQDRAARPRRGQPVPDRARAARRAPHPAVGAGGGAGRLQGRGAHARGLLRAPPHGRVPRRRVQARRSDGGQPGRGGAQQRDRHARRRARRGPARGAAVRARIDRQGGRPRRP